MDIQNALQNIHRQIRGTLLLMMLVLIIVPGTTPSAISMHPTMNDEPATSPTPTYISLRMPRVRPSKADDYFCTGTDIGPLGTQYIHKFEPMSNASIAHHMLLFACDAVEGNLLEKGYWDCSHHYFSCKNMRTLYAWAKNADSTALPQDVGIRIGRQWKLQYLVLQVHYKHPISPESEGDESGFRIHVAQEEPIYLAGLVILLRFNLTIPPNTEKTHGNMNCILNTTEPLIPFAYRVHTHNLGSVVSGYYLKSGQLDFEPIAKGNPQWPQAFYPMEHEIEFHPNDTIFAQCTFNTIGYNIETHIGFADQDEMCLLWIMYYTKSRDPKDQYILCPGEHFEGLNRALPLDSDKPLPRNISLEERASAHDQHAMLQQGNPMDDDHSMLIFTSVLVSAALILTIIVIRSRYTGCCSQTRKKNHIFDDNYKVNSGFKKLPILNGDTESEGE